MVVELRLPVTVNGYNAVGATIESLRPGEKWRLLGLVGLGDRVGLRDGGGGGEGLDRP
jgi:hypothetical protein